jgi:Na+/melibiose symporter-like transporter
MLVKLKRSTLAAFAGPNMPLAAIGLPLIVYLPPYYAGSLGLDLAVVGLIFFLVRLIDLPLDPLLGHLMDGTDSRWGRYRPWLVAGAAITMAGAWLVFMAAPGISPYLAFAQLMFMYVGYSIMMVAQLGWGATLTSDYHQRSRVFGWHQATGVFGMILVLMLPWLVGRATGAEEAGPGIQAMGWFVILLVPLTAFAIAAMVPERPRLTTRTDVTWADFKSLAKNPLMRRLLVVDMLAGLAPGITGAMFIFYFEHRLGFSASEASLLLLVYFVAGFAAAPLWMRIATRFGKHRTAALGGLVYCTTHGALALLPADGVGDAMIGMALAGIPYTAALFLLRAMLADVADADRLETGLDRNGLLQAVLTTTLKIAHAAPVAIIYPILGLIGFDPAPTATNSADAILGMTLIFVLLPIALMSAATFIIARWPHDEAAHARLQAALAARGAAE